MAAKLKSFGIAESRDEFVRGGYAATHKFIPPISNPNLLKIELRRNSPRKPFRVESSLHVLSIYAR
jgi:hypothetical protein